MIAFTERRVALHDGEWVEPVVRSDLDLVFDDAIRRRLPRSGERALRDDGCRGGDVGPRRG